VTTKNTGKHDSIGNKKDIKRINFKQPDIFLITIKVKILQLVNVHKAVSQKGQVVSWFSSFEHN
jgi:hypothetical protein